MKKSNRRGPLFGLGTSGYLETPSVHTEDSVSNPSLVGRSRSNLSLIPLHGNDWTVLHNESSKNTCDQANHSISVSSGSSSITMKSLMGGYTSGRDKRHLQKMNLLSRLGGLAVKHQTTSKAGNKPKSKPKSKTGGNRTSNIQGLYESNAVEVCDEKSTTMRPVQPISNECNQVLNEQWPPQLAPFQFVYVLSWNAVIYGGMNRDNQLWIFSEPIPFPPFGLPQNAIIPLPDSFDPNELYPIVSGSKPLPAGWNRLPPWSQVQGLQELLFAWWKKLTNECVGPICAFNHALDPFTGHCLSKQLSLHPVANSNLEFLKGKRSSRKLVLDDATRAQLKWHKLDHLLLYQRTSNSDTPELELVGVVERPVINQTTATIRLFPYGIPVGHSYELNIESFGLPEPYLGILLEHLRSPQPNSQITVSILDKKEANTILLQMQRQMGDFLVLPSTCLFESSLERPGVYMVKESSCHVMNNSLLYDYKGESKDGVEIKQVTDSQRPQMFVAYLAERDARHPDRGNESLPVDNTKLFVCVVNVLAGFNSQMQLILPEYDLSIPIDLATKIPSPPVEFSALMAPFVYDALNQDTINRLNQLDFVKTLLPFSS